MMVMDYAITMIRMMTAMELLIGLIASLDPTETTDSDSDGIGNNADNDDDNDGVEDDLDAFDTTSQPLDFDDDHICDIQDSDDDGDGILTVNEISR